MNRKQIAKQSTRAKERFGVHISHEIGTPMNTVVGMAHLLQKTNPEQREYLEALQCASSNLLGILNDILDFSKIEAGMAEFAKVEFRLAEILENVKQILRHRVVHEFIDSFLETTPSYVQEVRHQCDEKNWPGLRASAHRFKTAIRYVGLSQLAHIVETIEENAAQPTNTGNLSELIAAMNTIYNISVKELKNHEREQSNSHC